MVNTMDVQLLKYPVVDLFEVPRMLQFMYWYRFQRVDQPFELFSSNEISSGHCELVQRRMYVVVWGVILGEKISGILWKTAIWPGLTAHHTLWGCWQAGGAQSEIFILKGGFHSVIWLNRCCAFFVVAPESKPFSVAHR